MTTRNGAYRVAFKRNWRRTAVGVLRRALEHNGRQMLIVHTEDPNAARIENTGIRVEETRDGMRRHGAEPDDDSLVVDRLHVRIQPGRGDRSLGNEILDSKTDVAFHPVDVDLESLESRPIATRPACAKLTAGELAADTTHVTTKSGATTLPTEPPAETWTVIEVDPTGMRKPGECGSYHEAVGRAVDQAMSRQRNG